MTTFPLRDGHFFNGELFFGNAPLQAEDASGQKSRLL